VLNLRSKSRPSTNDGFQSHRPTGPTPRTQVLQKERGGASPASPKNKSRKQRYPNSDDNGRRSEKKNSTRRNPGRGEYSFHPELKERRDHREKRRPSAKQQTPTEGTPRTEQERHPSGNFTGQLWQYKPTHTTKTTKEPQKEELKRVAKDFVTFSVSSGLKKRKQGNQGAYTQELNERRGGPVQDGNTCRPGVDVGTNERG